MNIMEVTKGDEGLVVFTAKENGEDIIYSTDIEPGGTDIEDLADIFVQELCDSGQYGNELNWTIEFGPGLLEDY